MTKLYTLILILIIGCSTASMGTPLAGMYTIGGVNPDYISLSDAITALDSNGVSAAVLFNIRDGIYNEGLIFNAIAGASSVNTITFQSESHDSTGVEINFTTTATQHNGIYLNHVSYIRFHQLSVHQTSSIYNMAVIFVDRGNYLTISNCVLSGINSGTTSATDYVIEGCSDTGMVIQNCNLSGGTNGVYLSATGTNAYNLLVDHNNFTFISDDMLSMNMCYNAIISSNSFNGTSSNTMRGIMLQYCYSTQIFNNNIVLFNVVLNTSGIQIISSNGIAADHSKLYNNVISITTSAFNTISYALRCSSVKNFDFCYNNISHFGGSSSLSGASVYIDGSNYGNDSILILNNIFARFDNNTNSAVLKTDLTGPNVRSDYNLIYSAFGKITSAYTNFSQYQTGSMRDSNSISLDPLFVSTTDLHANNTQINGAAIPVNYITTDIIGNTRNSMHPTIGAYESASAPVAVNAIQYISFCENTTDTLSASFYGTSPISYQWYKNGSLLLNATTTDFTIPSAQQSDSGTYQCIATNSLGSDTAIIVVTVNALPNTSVSQINDTLLANLNNANYQWIDCSNNSAISNAVSQVYIPGVNGNYAVVITQNACVDTSACYPVVLTGTEMSSRSCTTNLSLYPNPAKDAITVSWSSCKEKLNLHKIMDVMGKEIDHSFLETNTSNNQLWSLNIQNLQNGIYFLFIDDAVVKFVKEIE